MGDLSAEPSMEDILSSIKKIIAEEGDGTSRKRPVPRASAPEPIDDVLELHQAVETVEPEEPVEQPVIAPPMPPKASTPATRIPAEPVQASAPATAPILSAAAAQASRGALDQLSKMVVRPEAGSDGTLEGLVRELLRPMLSDWLDAHLPGIVEAIVAREVERIASGR